MASSWQETTLGAVTTWSSGGTPKKDDPRFWGGDIPWISANSMHSTRFSESDLRLTEQGLESGSRLASKDSVLLLVRGGALHKRIPVGIAMRDLAFNQDVKALVARPDKLRAWYLLFWLMGMENSLLDSVVEYTGIGAGKLDTKRMQALVLHLPPLHEQDAIIATLKSIDDRIDLLRRTNVTLEALAQVIFKSWFVDFAPVHAKAEGRDPEGMDAATSALFPGEFEDSELGLIPKGWKIRSLDSIANYLNGLALQKFPPESDSVYLPVIKIAQLRAGHTSGADRASAHLKPDYVVRDGDVLFSWSGSLEVEFWCGGNGALNQHLFKVTSSEVPKWLCYLATKHFLQSFRETAAHKATTMGHIQRKHLTEARLALPSKDVLNSLSPLIANLLDRRVCSSVQIRELAALRDTLIPRLISGKLRIPEAAPLADEVEG